MLDILNHWSLGLIQFLKIYPTLTIYQKQNNYIYILTFQ